MKDTFAAQLDSQAIRQGLLSIRKSQIELLKELKSETMQLTKNPIRFQSSTEDSTPQEKAKADFFVQSSKKETNAITPTGHKSANINGDFKLEYSPQRMTSQYKVSLSLSPKTIQKQSILGFTGEKEKPPQKTYLQEENKMLNGTLEKLLVSRSADKQRIRDLESYVYFSQKMFMQIIRQFLCGSSVLQILKAVENDLTINRDIYSKYPDSSHFHLLEQLKHHHLDYHSQNGPNKKERQLLLPNEQLRQRLAMFQRAEHQQNDSKASLQVENHRLLQQLEIAKKRFFQLQKEIQRLNIDNKQLAIFWQRENSQRKTLATQLQKAKKQLAKNDQKYQLIISLQKDLAKTQKELKQKENYESNTQENMKRLSEAIVHFREENEILKRQVKSIQEIKENLKKEQQTFNKQTYNQMKTQILHQTAMLANYEQEIHDLRHHLASLKQHQEMMLQTQARQRQKEMVAHEISWKKVNAIKINSAIDHLWQVKEMEYHNINELFRSLLQKQLKM